MAALLVAGGFVLQPTAVAFVARLPWFRNDPPEQINYTQNWVQGVVITPLMIAAFLVAAILWGEVTGSQGVTSFKALDSYGALFLSAWKYWPFPLSVVFVSFWLLSVCSVANRRRSSELLVAMGAPIRRGRGAARDAAGIVCSSRRGTPRAGRAPGKRSSGARHSSR